jgi:hypothetical protein
MNTRKKQRRHPCLRAGVGNFTGVVVGAPNVTIGGTAAGVDNLISGKAGSGVLTLSGRSILGVLPWMGFVH